MGLIQIQTLNLMEEREVMETTMAEKAVMILTPQDQEAGGAIGEEDQVWK